MTPLASVVIVTYGKRELTERCLQSLERALGPKLGSEWEVLVVDNASPDDTPDLLRAWSERVEVILLDHNLNYAGGNNLGAREARGDVVVFLNNDTEVPAGSLEALAEQAREPGVGAVGVRLLYPDGTIQHGGVGFRRDHRNILHAFHLFLHEPGDLPAANAVFDLDVVTGACVAMRRDLFLELGGFDEVYVNGYEDVDLCLKVRTAGHRVVYRGDTFLWHAESATRGRSWDMSKNDAILRSRWESVLDEDHATTAQLFGGRLDRDRSPWHPGYLPFGQRVSVEGLVSGISAEAAEARSLIAVLEAAGAEPAARDWYEPYVLPQLHPEEEKLLLYARSRPLQPQALRIAVGVAPVTPLVARLAAPAPLPDGISVWAATRALAARTGGVYLPPAVLPLPVGPGGEGVLAVVPADPAAARAALERAASFGGPVRVLPLVASPAIRALAAGHEIFAPITSDITFAMLAAQHDVVVCADGDPFQRRALTAAAVGALPVAPPGGPAADVLGDDLGASITRADRAAVVQATCGFDALAPLLLELLEPVAAPALGKAA